MSLKFSNNIFDFDNVKIGGETSSHLKEMCQIFKSNNTINEKPDITHLSEIYSELLTIILYNFSIVIYILPRHSK